jgi:hypothetical protein
VSVCRECFGMSIGARSKKTFLNGSRIYPENV